MQPDQNAGNKTVAATVAPAKTNRKSFGRMLGNELKELAGTTGLEPATSDVTGLRSGSAESATCLCFQRPKGDKLRHGSPLNPSERYLHFTPTSLPLRDRVQTRSIAKTIRFPLASFGSYQFPVGYRFPCTTQVPSSRITVDIGFSARCFTEAVWRVLRDTHPQPRSTLPGLLG